MKRLFMFCLLLSMTGTTLFNSCTTEEPQRLIQDELLADSEFTDAVKSSLDVVILAQENNWIENAEQIKDLVVRANDGDQLAEAEMTSLLGMTRQEYLSHIESFAMAINDMYTKYPQIGEMSNEERQALFTDVIGQNEELQVYILQLQEELRGCFIQDLCNGIVSLAALIGGPFLCEYLAGVIPVVGPMICGIIIDVAQDLLTGLCNALPC